MNASEEHFAFLEQLLADTCDLWSFFGLNSLHDSSYVNSHDWVAGIVQWEGVARLYSVCVCALRKDNEALCAPSKDLHFSRNWLCSCNPGNKTWEKRIRAVFQNARQRQWSLFADEWNAKFLQSAVLPSPKAGELVGLLKILNSNIWWLLPPPPLF